MYSGADYGDFHFSGKHADTIESGLIRDSMVHYIDLDINRSKSIMHFVIHSYVLFLVPDTRVNTQASHYVDGKATMGLPLGTFAPYSLCDAALAALSQL